MNKNEFSAVLYSAPDLFENLTSKENSLKDSKTARLLQLYYSMNYQFKIVGRPELTERMLRQIMMSGSISRDFQLKPLYINISGIIDELMMNEIEIALWAIYLEITVWKNFDNFSEQALLFSAYKSKLFLNGNGIEPIKVYLMAKIEGFQKKFNLWHQQHEGQFDVDPKLINSKLNQLKKFEDPETDYGALSYNYYVDVILSRAIPYAERNQSEILRVQQKLKKRNKGSKGLELIKKAEKEYKGKPRKIRKIEKHDILSNRTRQAEKDPEIEKIERYCDGLLENNDLRPDDFFNY